MNYKDKYFDVIKVLCIGTYNIWQIGNSSLLSFSYVKPYDIWQSTIVL